MEGPAYRSKPFPDRPRKLAGRGIIIRIMGRYPTLSLIHISFAAGDRKQRLTGRNGIAGLQRPQRIIRLCSNRLDLAVEGSSNPGEGDLLLVLVVEDLGFPVSYTHLDVYKRQAARYAG